MKCVSTNPSRGAGNSAICGLLGVVRVASDDPPTSPPLYGLDALSDDGAVSDDAVTEVRYVLPRVPASSGALIFDGDGRLLILKPNYKKGWTIPGGQIDSNGESPWDACRRETQEECGLEVVRSRWSTSRSFRTPEPNRTGGLRFPLGLRHVRRQRAAVRPAAGR